MTATATRHAKRPVIAHSLRILAVPIILFWIAVAVLVNVIAPQLEVVGEAHAAPMAPEDAPSMQAMKRMGANFKEFDSNSTVMIVVEGQQPLGPDAHAYYDEIIRKLRQDPEHIQHIQDFWGDTLTAAGAQSADGKASYVMLNLAGEQGQTLANEGVEAVRKVIDGHQGPARGAGLRRRPGCAHRRFARHRQRQPGSDHPVHPGGDRGHVADRLSVDQDDAGPAFLDRHWTGDRRVEWFRCLPATTRSG